MADTEEITEARKRFLAANEAFDPQAIAKALADYKSALKPGDARLATIDKKLAELDKQLKGGPWKEKAGPWAVPQEPRQSQLQRDTGAMDVLEDLSQSAIEGVSLGVLSPTKGGGVTIGPLTRGLELGGHAQSANPWNVGTAPLPPAKPLRDMFPAPREQVVTDSVPMDYARLAASVGPGLAGAALKGASGVAGTVGRGLDRATRILPQNLLDDLVRGGVEASAAGKGKIAEAIGRVAAPVAGNVAAGTLQAKMRGQNYSPEDLKMDAALGLVPNAIAGATRITDKATGRVGEKYRRLRDRHSPEGDTVFEPKSMRIEAAEGLSPEDDIPQNRVTARGRQLVDALGRSAGETALEMDAIDAALAKEATLQAPLAGAVPIMSENIDRVKNKLASSGEDGGRVPLRLQGSDGSLGPPNATLSGVISQIDDPDGDIQALMARGKGSTADRVAWHPPMGTDDDALKAVAASRTGDQWRPPLAADSPLQNKDILDDVGGEHVFATAENFRDVHSKLAHQRRDFAGSTSAAEKARAGVPQVIDSEIIGRTLRELAESEDPQTRKTVSRLLERNEKFARAMKKQSTLLMDMKLAKDTPRVTRDEEGNQKIAMEIDPVARATVGNLASHYQGDARPRASFGTQDDPQSLISALIEADTDSAGRSRNIVAPAAQRIDDQRTFEESRLGLSGHDRLGAQGATLSSSLTSSAPFARWIKEEGQALAMRGGPSVRGLMARIQELPYSVRAGGVDAIAAYLAGQTTSEVERRSKKSVYDEARGMFRDFLGLPEIAKQIREINARQKADLANQPGNGQNATQEGLGHE